MSASSTPEELVGRTADERLLGERIDDLPPSLGRPEAIPDSRTRARARLVAIGVMLTGASLILGLALLAVGVVVAVASGFDGLSLVALVAGAILAGTHWGWVHVAERTANSVQARRDADVSARRRQWLAGVQPYARFEVATRVDDDGSIAIVVTRYVPVPRGEREFTFVRRAQLTESHSGDEPGAAITERAELLRRRAAADTAAERERYLAVADDHETAALRSGDDRSALAARRAASEALSERINSNLEDPPLTE